MTAAHLATGVAHNLDVALVEAAATITGTNASTVNPELLSLGMLLFRALGQWLAAAAIIIVLVRVLPHLGVEESQPVQRDGSLPEVAQRWRV